MLNTYINRMFIAVAAPRWGREAAKLTTVPLSIELLASLRGLMHLIGLAATARYMMD
jgi:hypothetical protein